jgi:hypothetical protein
MEGYVVLLDLCLDFLTAEDETDRLFRNVGGNYEYTLRNIAEGRRSHLLLHRKLSLYLLFCKYSVCRSFVSLPMRCWCRFQSLGYKYLQIG